MLRILLILIPLLLAGQAPVPAPDWSAWTFLLGEWEGVGGGNPGEATRGGFSFEQQLGGRLMVRKNFAEYPNLRHEDLLVVWAEPGQARKRATYFDSEGHVIDYRVEETEPGRVIRFTSAAGVPGPRYRLVLTKTGGDSVSVRFEIASPGKPDAFSLYVEGLARRKSR